MFCMSSQQKLSSFDSTVINSPFLFAVLSANGTGMGILALVTDLLIHIFPVTNALIILTMTEEYRNTLIKHCNLKRGNYSKCFDISVMDKILEEVMDFSLLIAQSYLLFRLALSANPYLKTPFFFFFLVTGSFQKSKLCDELWIIGALGCLSVIGFFIASRLQIRAEKAWILKCGYVTIIIYYIHFLIMNTFGLTGSTIGKICIVAHRHAVMRNVKMIENVWSNRLNYYLLGVILALSGIRCIFSFFCGYTYSMKDEINYATYVDDE
ncbi:hypothetical protein PRIPAC_78663 [Pristionchus pacificus]|uniref:Uncharacterized protein n=1 Tax=Pristionchus pacificus TaxID=54126 RepID=A0A2A6CPX3_PRIPA|nr:hypothetical protein PRIPAC_78663 [Pristionchus pacificus]|eukprot:PDM80254.1 hypothetical protein PRIPAC_32833 [Pristionchus pacificus]